MSRTMTAPECLEVAISCANAAIEYTRDSEFHEAVKELAEAVFLLVEAQPTYSERWEPMDSAPKDGRPLLLFARSKLAGAPCVVVGWFHAPSGWIECAFHPNMPTGIEPFFWQPLPAFPEMRTCPESDQ